MFVYYDNFWLEASSSALGETGQTGATGATGPTGSVPSGATGTFISQDGKTVTVTNGIITNIV